MDILGRGWMVLLRAYLLCLGVLACMAANAQEYKLINDPEKLTLVKRSINAMYNWEFEQARAYISQVEAELSEHPVVPFARAMILYWENVPLDFTKESYQKHISLLEEASALADARLERNEDDIEGQFFKMSSRSLIMKHLADSGQPMKAIGEAKGVYKLIKRGFDLKEEYVEYYFTTGVYNYYREYYPEKYPVYKPFAVFFQKGDMELGLDQLQYTAKNATFTKAEAYSYLAHIYLRYEESQQKAIGFSSELVSRYPRNLYFKARHMEVLYLSKQYQDIEKNIPLLMRSSDSYYQAVGYMYSGKLLEQKGEYGRAMYFYRKAEKLIANMLYRFADQKTYLYYGMANCLSEQGDYEGSKKYYRKAKEHDQDNYLKGVDKPEMRD